MASFAGPPVLESVASEAGGHQKESRGFREFRGSNGGV